MRLLPLFALFVTSPALAEPEVCTPLAEAELVDRIHASLDAIYREDVPGYQAIIIDLESRIPCLEFVPSPERWAELLVGIAIIEFSTEDNWQQPLATAFHIDPYVNTLVGQSHGFFEWRPEPAPPHTDQKVPEGVRLYVDGQQVRFLPEMTGMHLVQLRTGDGWRSLLLRDGEIPSEWLDVGELGFASKVNVRVDAGLTGGAALWSQSTETPGTFLTDDSTTGPGVGVAARGSVGRSNGLGAYWDVGLPNLPNFVGTSIQGGGQMLAGPMEFYAGAGALQSQATANDQPQNAFLWFPSLGAGITTQGDLPIDGRVLAGFTPALLQTAVNTGITLGNGGMRIRFGGELLWRKTKWQQGESGREVVTNATNAGLNVGVRWGQR